MRSRPLAAIPLLVALALATMPAAAGVVLTLKSGERFAAEAVDYQRDEGIYVLELASGDLLPIPAELVRGLRLTGGDAPAPTGITIARPKTVAGVEQRELPKPVEQLRVFEGNESRFRRSVINPFWRPSSDWEMSVSRNSASRMPI